MTVITSIEDLAVITQILEPLDRRAEPATPVFRPFARAPPPAELPGLRAPGRWYSAYSHTGTRGWSDTRHNVTRTCWSKRSKFRGRPPSARRRRRGPVKFRRKRPPFTQSFLLTAFEFNLSGARSCGRGRLCFLVCSSVPEIVMMAGAGVGGAYSSFGPVWAPTHIEIVPTPSPLSADEESRRQYGRFPQGCAG